MEKLYLSIQEEIDHTLKQDVVIIIDDWKAKVGNKTATIIVVKYGLGYRNKAGE